MHHALKYRWPDAMMVRPSQHDVCGNVRLYKPEGVSKLGPYIAIDLMVLTLGVLVIIKKRLVYPAVGHCSLKLNGPRQLLICVDGHSGAGRIRKLNKNPPHRDSNPRSCGL
jgi:hypothetical protein